MDVSIKTQCVGFKLKAVKVITVSDFNEIVRFLNKKFKTETFSIVGNDIVFNSDIDKSFKLIDCDITNGILEGAVISTQLLSINNATRWENSELKKFKECFMLIGLYIESIPSQRVLKSINSGICSTYYKELFKDIARHNVMV